MVFGSGPPVKSVVCRVGTCLASEARPSSKEVQMRTTLMPAPKGVTGRVKGMTFGTYPHLSERGACRRR